MSMHISASRGEVAESVLLPGDPLRAKYIAEHFLDSPIQYNSLRNMYGYTGSYRGVPVSVQGTGMGNPSIGIYSWELMAEYGVTNLIRIGTAGSIREDVHLRDLIIAVGSSTNSQYSGNFIPVGGRFAPIASWDLLCRARDSAERLGLPYLAGNVFNSDYYYEAKPDWFKKWADMGCLAVEMEAAALYMNAAWLGRSALAIMTVSNSLITGEETTPEERETSFDDMIKLALETAAS